MSNEHLSYLLALIATLSFASASLIFTTYSQRISVLWMNAFKAMVGLVSLLIVVPIFTNWVVPIWSSFSALMLSGLVGLAIGDLFLLKAFTRVGPARTLMVFGFAPLIVGTGAYFLFDQPLEPRRFIAIFFLITCLFIFSFERFRVERNWEVGGLVFAVVGVLLDGSGVLLTRWGYAHMPEMPALEGHLFRCLGAMVGFAVIGFFRPFGLWRNFVQLNWRDRRTIFFASFFGTAVALGLSLTAIQIGHLASIASIGITGPIFAAALECYVKREWPSRYLLLAFASFAIGFSILVF